MFLSLKQAAREIGLTPQGLRMTIEATGLPVAHRIGRRLIKIDRRDLDSYIAASVIQPTVPAE